MPEYSIEMEDTKETIKVSIADNSTFAFLRHITFKLLKLPEDCELVIEVAREDKDEFFIPHDNELAATYQDCRMFAYHYCWGYDGN